jgi:radical SAM-linked protein
VEAADAPGLPKAPGPPPSRHRYRVKFRKRGRARFLGHLDLMRALLRSLRRARVPLLYSQGFNPKPRVQFGPALPVGIESFGEYFDFDTPERLDPSATAERLAASLPRDLEVERLREIPPGSASLGETIRAARYRVEVDGGVDVRGAYEAFLGRGTFEMERRRRDRRVRVSVDPSAVGVDRIERGRFVLTIPAGGSEAVASAEEILTEMLGPGRVVRIVREDLLVDRDACLVSPILEAEPGEGIDLRTAV